jgi:ABC-type lipoprotein export system ATPase subunit
MKPVAARSRVVKWNPLDRRTRARTASPNQVVLHLDAATQARPFGTTGGVLPAAAVAGRQASMLHARTHTDDLVADKYTSVPSADLDPLQQHHRAISMPAQTLRQWTRQRLPPPMDSDFPVELIRSHSRPGSSPAVVPVSPTSTASTADHSRSNSRNNAPPVWSAETMVPPPAIPSYPAQLSSQPEVVIESKPDVWTSDDKHHVPVQIVYENIKFEVEITKNKTTEKRPILKGCSGSFEPGRFTAVMGASGAGKTSLMNIISGNRTAGKHEGMLKINGQDVFDQPKRMREISAFIMQDDILLGTQTVREAIILSARLRLPKSMPDADKITRADEVIDLLGLRKCQDTIIGDRFHKGVSGGEKRRVSMALELVKSPSVLFLGQSNE